MAEKTYVDIGRVAPVVKGDWSSATAYNKLNIVSNSGGSYIAKKDVPAGTALSNTEYWMQLMKEVVTSWRATPTDENVPSEKLVYDTIGDISSAIDALLNGVS